MSSAPPPRRPGGRRWDRPVVLRRWFALLCGVFPALFLLLGTASLPVTAGTAGASLGGSTLYICKNGNVSGTFQFSLDSGAPVSVAAGSCGEFPIENGYNTIEELPDPSGATQLSAITVSPSIDTVSNSVPKRTVVVNVPADQTVTTTFTNIPTPRIEVCKVAGTSSLLGQPFDFTYNSGTPFVVTAGAALQGNCSTPEVFALNASVTVAEQVPSGDTVTNITSAGAGSCTTSLSSATAACTLGTTGLTMVTYTDAREPQIEVCKVAGTSSLLGQPFDFTYNSGTPFVVKAGAAPQGNCSTPQFFSPGAAVTVAEQVPSGDSVSNVTVAGTGSCTTSLSSATAACTLGATGLTTVTYTDTNEPQIEVCKVAGTSSLLGQPFDFTYNSGTPFVVKAGAAPQGNCSTPEIFAPNASVTVAEQVPSGDTVTNITSGGTGSCTTSLASATAACTLGATGFTTVTYTDASAPQIEVCKVAGDSSTLNQSFDFTYNAGTPFAVTAGAAPQGNCSTPEVFAPNASVTVAEQVPSGDTVTNITSGGTGLCTTTLASATAACTLGATGLTTVTYTDASARTGYLEVCKVAGDASVKGHSFTFSVNGGPTFQVKAGGCSPAIAAPIGVSTVAEIESNATFYLAKVSTVSPTDPTGARLLTGPTVNPARVQVLSGGVANETVVTFTNDSLESVLKICTGQTSPGANLAGVAMPYTYSYTVNGSTKTGSISLVTPSTGATCSGLIGPFHAFNDNGTAVVVKVTAQQPSVIAVDLAAYSYQGSGSVSSAPTLPATFPATVTVDAGIGVNIVSFTNGASH